MLLQQLTRSTGDIVAGDKAIATMTKVVMTT